MPVPSLRRVCPDPSSWHRQWCSVWATSLDEPGAPPNYGDDATPWPSVLYAANIAAVYVMLAAIWGYAKHGALMDREMAAHVHRRIFDARIAVALVFLLSIPAAFVLNAYTPFVWLLLLPASWLARWFSARPGSTGAAQD
jgi:hypothetical protein